MFHQVLLVHFIICWDCLGSVSGELIFLKLEMRQANEKATKKGFASFKLTHWQFSKKNYTKLQRRERKNAFKLTSCTAKKKKSELKFLGMSVCLSLLCPNFLSLDWRLQGLFPPALKNTFHFNVAAAHKVICHLIMTKQTQRHFTVKCVYVREGSLRGERGGGVLVSS